MRHISVGHNFTKNHIKSTYLTEFVVILNPFNIKNDLITFSYNILSQINNSSLKKLD